MGVYVEQENDQVGRAARLKDTVLTIRGSGEKNKGVFKVRLETVRTQGSSYIGWCRVHMSGKDRHGHSPSVAGSFEFSPMNSTLEIEARQPYFKAEFMLANFNLVSESGTGLITDQQQGEQESTAAQTVAWRLDHWGKANGRNGR